MAEKINLGYKDLTEKQAVLYEKLQEMDTETILTLVDNGKLTDPITVTVLAQRALSEFTRIRERDLLAHKVDGFFDFSQSEIRPLGTKFITYLENQAIGINSYMSRLFTENISSQRWKKFHSEEPNNWDRGTEIIGLWMSLGQATSRDR